VAPERLGRAAVLKPDDEVVLNDGSAEEGNFPADGTPLVQGVVSTGSTQLLDDNLDVRLALATQLHAAEGVLTVDKGRMDFDGVAAAGGQDADILGVCPVVGHGRAGSPAEFHIRIGRIPRDLLDAHQRLGVPGRGSGVCNIDHLASQLTGDVGRHAVAGDSQDTVGRIVAGRNVGSQQLVGSAEQVILIRKGLAVVNGVELHVVDGSKLVLGLTFLVLVLVGILPIVVFGEVIIGVLVALGMEVAIREGLRTLALQVAHSKLNHRIGDFVAASDSATGRNAAGIHDVQTGTDGVAANGVNRELGLPVQPVRHRLSLAVNVPQIDFIGVAHPAAVVLGDHGEGRLFEVLAVRGHAFVQGLVSGRKFAVAEERDVLAVVFGLLNHVGIVQIAEIQRNVFKGTALEIRFQQGRCNTRGIRIVHKTHSF